MFRFQIQDIHPVGQLFTAFFIALFSVLLFFLMGMLLAIPFWGSTGLDAISAADLTNPRVVNLLKYYQIVESIGLFIVPPFLLASFFSVQPLGYLQINKKIDITSAMIIAMVMLFCIPVVNYLAMLNSAVKLPSALSGLEHFFQAQEQSAQRITEAFMNTNVFGVLLINILMMGVIPALGEELFFRGIVQRILINWTKNVHVGVIVTGLFFSVVHMQFYGLFPRWILGVLLGYFYVWSGSLWASALAHFVFNTISVVVYFLISSGMAEKNMTEIGSTTQFLPYTILCLVISFAGVFYLYKTWEKSRAGSLKGVFE
jgi:uncharacterized protein